MIIRFDKICLCGCSEEVGEGLSLARNWKAVVGEHNQVGMDGTEQVLNVVSIHKHRQFFIKRRSWSSDVWQFL